MNRRAEGRAAEDRAAEFLMEHGLTIVTRRYKTRSGELDLIALEDDVLVFVEVKQRHSTGSAEESVGVRKSGRIRQAAHEYLIAADESQERQIRFDVVAIDPDGIRHHRDALLDLPTF